MKLQIGRYTVTSRVLRLFFFACLLLGIIIGVLYAIREDGKPITWLPLLPGMLLTVKLLKNAFLDFKADNHLD